MQSLHLFLNSSASYSHQLLVNPTGWTMVISIALYVLHSLLNRLHILDCQKDTWYIHHAFNKNLNEA